MSPQHNAARVEAEQYDRPSQPLTVPWKIDVIPDLFGYMVLVHGNSLYIPKEHFDAVLVALSQVKERESAGHDWLHELGEAIRGERGELGEAPAQGE